MFMIPSLNNIVTFNLPKRFVLGNSKWSWEVPLRLDSRAMFNGDPVVVGSVTKLRDSVGCQQIHIRLIPLEETGLPNSPYRLNYNKIFVATVPTVGKVLESNLEALFKYLKPVC